MEILVVGVEGLALLAGAGGREPDPVAEEMTTKFLGDLALEGSSEDGTIDDVQREFTDVIPEALSSERVEPGRAGPSESARFLGDYAIHKVGLRNKDDFRAWLLGIVADARSASVQVRTVDDIAQYLATGRGTPR